MKELQEKLHRYIEKYGFTDPRTVEVSQELDVLVVAEQRRLIDAC
ncbi:Spo0E like sporulation regulatory protein [Clostridium amylolyticum]|uniref:Spo0E like sporulation regulatory protein n=1 Tax=Clostridium amylolyticum TaxID=1121298 RepID=A0A1M6L262_9CLOT|nr:aspartyl-phosphate phosphatase Spo0E family protein [Clostridium amylolyticum]SHJ65277.1 Spo0E like sporulation regulatory protein [Clostridium amylolyticum]